MADKPNLSPEAFLEHYRAVAGKKRELEAAQGAYRASLKAAKKAGVNQAQMIAAMQIKTNADEADVAMGFRDLGRYLRYLNVPLGTQFAMFDDQAADVPPEAQAKQDEWETHEAGYRAAQHGVDAADCPFPAGSEAAQVWSLGHKEGAKVVADVLAGNPAEPTKRRGRKAKGGDSIVAGAAA